MFEVPTLNKNKKEEDNTNKWKRFELDDVSELKIIVKLVLKLLMSLTVLQEFGVLQPSHYQ